MALGATIACALLGRPGAVLQKRGRWFVRADGLRVLETLHPSALPRMPPAEQGAGYRQWIDELALVMRQGH